MSNENELLEPLATEAGQQAIARAINNLGSLENAVRAERAAATATQKADEARNSAEDASDYATEARNWANKTDGYVAQETITIPPEQEGDEPTTETIDLYSARYYAAQAQDIYNNLQFDSVPTENSTNLISSGAVYTALNGKADKSDTYTKTEVDTALSNVQGQLTFDNVPTANSDNPVKSSGIKTALDGKQDTLTFDSTPTANSNNPVTSGGIYTALQNVNIDIDDEITEDSDNPVTSAAIWEALQNIEVTGGVGNASGVQIVQLYENSDGIENGTITLSEDWNNYDIINVVGGTGYYSSFIYTKQKFEEIKGDSSKYLFLNTMADSAYYCSLRIPNNNQIEIVQGANNHKLPISKVYGIKFSKNLSEQMYSNVLYQNDNGWDSETLTLSDNWDNYDLIQVDCTGGNQTIFLKQQLEIACDKYQNSQNDVYSFLSVVGWNENYINFNVISKNQFSFRSKNGNKIYKIIGIKLAKGGYSGIVSDARMTVKSGFVDLSNGFSGNARYDYNIVFDSPMPDNNYVVMTEDVGFANNYNNTDVTICDKTNSGFTLTIYQNGSRPATSDTGVSWIAIRPNSYTREGMVEDVLYTTSTGFTTGTINLSGNISDYDLIEFVIGDSTDGEKFTNNRVYSSSVLTNIMGQQNKFFHLAYYQGGWQMLSVDSDNQLSCSNRSGNTVLYKITGIKFGRYVSGVAVDTTVTQNSDAVVTSGAVYDALQNYTPSGGGSGGNITVDTTITENSQNPVTSAAIYAALQGAGGGGGSIVVDAVPTQNSTNAVQSGGVYDALQNISGGFEVFEIDGTKLTPVPNFTCDSKYYLDTKDTVLCTNWVYNEVAYLKNSIPCVFGQLRDDGCKVIVVSPIREGTEMYFKLKNGNSVDYIRTTTGTVTTSGGDLLYYTFTTDKVFGGAYSHDTAPNVQISGDWNSGSNSAQALITASQITITGDLSYNVDSTYIQEIQDQVVIKFNGELYYRCKETPVSNHIYFYSLDKKSQMEVKMLDFNFNSSIMTIKENVPIRSSLELDTTPTENSNNAITSGAVYTALQNAGGGSSITVDSTITQGGTNPVEGGVIYTALEDKADKSTTYTKTEVDTALGNKQGTLTFDTTPTQNSSNPVTSGGVYTALQNLPTGTGDVTTNTDQNITGTKTFVGSKKVGFKQSAANDKLGFTLFGNTGAERGYLEFNPQNTIDGVAGLMTLGNYATSAASLTQVGFRRYSNISGQSGAYNLLMPMVADARTPFSLTTSYQNFYLPLGFTYGTTTVKTAKSGLVDLSPLLASLEARIAALEGN